jgi:ribonuclease PH
MLYRFKSQAAAPVIMLQANGEQMLDIVGKPISEQGEITAAQIPAAVQALYAAIAAHEAAARQAQQDPHAVVEVQGDGVMLRQRAVPFIELLQVSAQEGKDVVWGV